jgi:imidazolonepropionase
MAASFDCLLINANLATMTETGTPYGAIRDAALAVEGGRIAWLGPMAALPRHEAKEVIDVGGGWVTPGLIDAHTHLVFAGDRADEFEQRLLGATYEEIARRGGGIAGTVRATRAAPAGELETAARRRLQRLLAEGVTTVEIKSGYGLDLATEIRMLEVARALGRNPGRRRLHQLPRRARAPARVRLRPQGLPRPRLRGGAAGSRSARARRCGRRLLRDHRLQPRGDGARLRGGRAPRPACQAARRPALRFGRRCPCRPPSRALGGSPRIHERGGRSRHGGGRHDRHAAARRLLHPEAEPEAADRGLPPARRADGDRHMACTLFGLSPEEALKGVTANAARALGLGQDRGTLALGRRADLAAWRIESPAEIVYWVGLCPLEVVLKDGRRSELAGIR